MKRHMVGPLVLLAAMASPVTPAIEPAVGRLAETRPATRSTAHATATIRIVSGVRFGPDQLSGAEGADRRKSVLAGADGLVYPAELLEFQ